MKITIDVQHRKIQIYRKIDFCFSKSWKSIPCKKRNEMDAWLLHRFYILLYTYKLDEFTFFFPHLVKTRTKKTRNAEHTCRWRCWLCVIGRGWLRVWIVIFLSREASLRIAAFTKLIKVGAACWQELLCSTVYPKLPSSLWLSITTAPYLHQVH